MGIIGIILILSLYVGFPYYTSKTIDVVITKTERVHDGKDSKYMIFTSEGVFENTDVWRYFKFNSSDIYNTLSSKINKQAHLKIYGFRIPILSMYPNVLEVE